MPHFCRHWYPCSEVSDLWLSSMYFHCFIITSSSKKMHDQISITHYPRMLCFKVWLNLRKWFIWEVWNCTSLHTNKKTDFKSDEQRTAGDYTNWAKSKTVWEIYDWALHCISLLVLHRLQCSLSKRPKHIIFVGLCHNVPAH